MLVKVSNKVRVGAGIHGWNVHYSGTVILLDFIHDPVHSYKNPAFLRNAAGLDKSSLY